MEHVQITNSPKERGAWPRYVNLVLGAYLFASAFLWDMGPAAFNNAWMTGALVALVAIGAMFAPTMRYMSAVLGLMLIVLTFATPHTNEFWLWHHVAVGAAFIAVGFIPTGAGMHRRAHVPAHAAR